MVLSHSPEQAAIAAQLTEELAIYQSGLAALMERRWDPDLYRRVSDRFDRMQMYAGSLPALAGSWTEVLISRVDLMQALWTVSSPSRLGGKLRGAHADHQRQLAQLRRACVPYVQAAARSQDDSGSPTRL